MFNAIRHEIQDIDTGPKALRSFGLLVGGILIGIGLVMLWRHDGSITTAVLWCGGLGGVLIAGGVLYPNALRVPYRVWMALAVVLGFVMTRVILTAVFYLVITPTGLLLRLFAKDQLDRAWDADAPTYWIEKQYDNESPERLERYY